MGLTYRKIIITAILVVIGMSLLPPFVIVNKGTIINRGYHFILSPPHVRANVNVGLLLAQVGLVSLITCAVCFLKSKDDEAVPPPIHTKKSPAPGSPEAIEKMLGISLDKDHPVKEESVEGKRTPVLTSFKWAAALSLSYVTIPVVLAVWNGYDDLGGFLAVKLMTAVGVFTLMIIPLIIWNVVILKTDTRK